MATQTAAVKPADPDEMPRKFSFPSAFTILYGVTIVVWLLAFAVPTGAYTVSKKTGGPVPGSYHHVESGLSFYDRLMQLFMAPVNGLYGIKASDGGFISPSASGELFGA
ncbi:MAG: YfcC family protein, partial [Allobranchiibius sp.]